MIKKSKYKSLKTEVIEAVNELFEVIKGYGNQENFILFLSRSKYEKSKDTDDRGIFICDFAGDEMKDQSRNQFLLDYLNQAYSFRGSVNSSDSGFSISLELMMYSHIWESHRNLTTYKHVADLASAQPFDWNLQIPDDSKFKFIKNKVREPLKTKCPKVYTLLNEVYKSQYRNAFAHSQYHFYFNDEAITLENYDGDDNPVRTLSFDDWTPIFLKSALFQIELHKRAMEEIKQLDQDSYSVKITHPDRKGMATIFFDRQNFKFRAQFD